MRAVKPLARSLRPQVSAQIPKRSSRAPCCRAASGRDVQACLDLLQIDDISGAEDLKTAYYARMRDLHPDVNPGRDTTADAAAVNDAYETLTQVWPCSHFCLSGQASRRCGCGHSANVATIVWPRNRVDSGDMIMILHMLCRPSQAAHQRH